MGAAEVRLQLMLPPAMWERAAQIGTDRYQRSKERGQHDSFGQDSEENHIYGARGEAAAAAALGLPWPHAKSVDGFVEYADILPNWEIRTCASPGGMKVRRPCDKSGHVKYCDPPERLVAFVFNRHGSPSYEMVGWVIADWAQRNRPLSDPGNRKRPAHFVKRSDLVPFTPDFHDIHGWARDPSAPSGWACAFCTTPYEGAVP